MEARLMMTRAHIATTVLTFVVPPDDAAMIVGDLEEEDATGLFAADRRGYWVQLIRSVPALLWLAIQRDGWFSTVVVALVACTVQAAIEVTTGLALHELVPSGALWASVLALALTLASLTWVSYLATRHRTGASVALAGVAVVTIALQLVMAAGTGKDLPLTTLTALGIAPATALVGGFLSSRTRSR
jgi:hypothetical protein